MAVKDEKRSDDSMTLVCSSNQTRCVKLYFELHQHVSRVQISVNKQMFKKPQNPAVERPVNKDSSCGCGIFRCSVGRKLAEAVDGASCASGQDMHDAARLKEAWSRCRSTG